MQSNIFQYAVLGIFVLLALVGLIFFATNDPDSQSVLVTPLTIWGPYDRNSYEDVLGTLDKTFGGMSKITYVEKSRAVLYDDLLEQLAAGGGPDIVIMDDSRLLAFADKVYALNQEVYPEKDLRAQFIQGAEVFQIGGALYAIPYTVDPLVLFWNRDIFENAGITVVPRYWDEFVQAVPRLTQIKDGSTITQSAVAFGVYDNVLHAKAILSMLMLQTGNPIAQWGSAGYASSLRTVSGASTNGPEAALRFYTDFSNPTKTVYSWNVSFDRSREAFMAGRVATYFGFVSEVPQLHEINPNLDFEIATVPQSRSNPTRATYGRFSGLAVTRNSRDPSRAIAVARVLSSAQGVEALQSVLGLPPIRRDLLNRAPTDTLGAVSYDSAIIARTWLEPSNDIAERIFSRMVNDVLSGKEGVSAALSNAHAELNAQQLRVAR